MCDAVGVCSYAKSVVQCSCYRLFSDECTFMWSVNMYCRVVYHERDLLCMHTGILNISILGIIHDS